MHAAFRARQKPLTIRRDLRKASQCTPLEKERLDGTRPARAGSKGPSSHFDTSEGGCHAQIQSAPSTGQSGTIRVMHRGSKGSPQHTLQDRNVAW